MIKNEERFKKVNKEEDGSKDAIIMMGYFITLSSRQSV